MKKRLVETAEFHGQLVNLFIEADVAAALIIEAVLQLGRVHDKRMEIERHFGLHIEEGINCSHVSRELGARYLCPLHNAGRQFG